MSETPKPLMQRLRDESFRIEGTMGLIRTFDLLREAEAALVAAEQARDEIGEIVQRMAAAFNLPAEYRDDPLGYEDIEVSAGTTEGQFYTWWLLATLARAARPARPEPDAGRCGAVSSDGTLRCDAPPGHAGEHWAWLPTARAARPEGA